MMATVKARTMAMMMMTMMMTMMMMMAMAMAMARTMEMVVMMVMEGIVLHGRLMRAPRTTSTTRRPIWTSDLPKATLLSAGWLVR